MTLIAPPKPGAYPGTPFATYRAWKALNASAINAGLLSMEHLQAQMQGESDTDSPEKLLGRVAHAITLGEAGFHEHYLVYRPDLPDSALTTAGLPKRNCKAGVERWVQLEAEADGRTIIGPETLGVANAIAAKVMRHPIAAPLVKAAGDAEVSIVWHEDGTPCKARIDRYVSKVLALDLKTTRCADRAAFERSVYSYGYHRQIAWYMRGFRAVYGEDTPFTVLAVETEPPFGVNVFQIDVDSLAVGMNDCEKVLRDYRKALDTGEWPGYVDPETGKPGVLTVSIPEWARREAQVLIPQEAVNVTGEREDDGYDILVPF